MAFNVRRNCRGKLPRKNIQEVVSQTIINPYSYFEKNDYSNNIDLKVGEPDFVPDSFKDGYLLSATDYHTVYCGI